jgi:negative regulator of sigma E activity
MNEKSPENFEDELRRRLRPVDAPEGFAERLMAALPVERKPTQDLKIVALKPRAARPSLRDFGMPAALAASLMVAVFLGVHEANDRALREEQRGIAASQELMQALRVTSQKLDLAYEAVNSPRPAGDEENRS